VRTRTIGVAIPIPEPHAQELQRVREGYGDPLARSIPTHVTLLAPVEVQADDLDRIEKRPLEYHRQVLENYRAQARADPARYRIIQADRTPEQVHEDVWRNVTALK